MMKYTTIGLVLVLFALCGGRASGQAVDTIPPVRALPVEVEAAADSASTVATDSVRKASQGVDAPVRYTSKDSMVMVMKGQNLLYLYGEGTVQYGNMDLKGEYIEVDANKNTVFATFGRDSIGEEIGYPVFKEGETQYEMNRVRYNFKTKKMYITDVITQQGDGFMTAGQTKKMENDDLFARNAQYSTCDDHEHKHFYLNLTKARIRPGKWGVTGPAYLVVEDVPLPIALPFAFFPFTSDYSSGVIMPTYGDELRRGFSLQNGGYYFAINDYMDMALTGEYFTRGSWGLDARSNYRKRYTFSGGLQASYRVTILGEKGEKDYSRSKDIKVSWNHSQDPKANPFGTFSASVNFSTSSYSQNDLSSLYSGQSSNNTAASNVSYNYRPPGSVFSFNANASINQVKRDTTLSVTLPNLTITMRELYPFQRKDRVGSPLWYENIRLSYTGVVSNSIQNVKEYDFMNKKLIGDWKNGMQHRIPLSASFNLFKAITLTPSVNYEERWYSSRINREYDYQLNRDVPSDTIVGFYRIYNYNASMSAQTKLYGTFRPWGIFGEWTKKTVIRHVFTPNVSFSGAPDFSGKKYGYYEDLTYETSDGRTETITYSPFSHNLWGVPGRGKSGSLNISLDNNLEMKIPIAGSDSTKKISLIDQFRLSTSYNFLADSMRWSNLNASLRLKLLKNYSLTLSGIFDIYEYDENGRQVDRLLWKKGKLGRFRGTSQTVSFSLNTETFKKWFGKKDKDGDNSEETTPPPAQTENEETPTDDANTPSAPASLRKPKEKEGNFDRDGYYLIDIPWNLNVNYSFGFAYDMQNFNKEKRIYPYKVTQNLGISGNISPSKNWSLTFNTGYDFDNKQFTPTQLSISRKMHCWSMSASVIPVGPYQSYSFTIAVNSSLLQDLKYNQSSSYYDSMHWGY